MTSTLILTESEALRLRLVLERGIQAVAVPAVAEKACRQQRKLQRELDEQPPSETNAVDDADDAAPMAANFSLNRKPESAEDAAP